MSQEKVLVFFHDTLKKNGLPEINGINTSPSNHLQAILNSHPIFLERDIAEISPMWKQLIPYIVVRSTYNDGTSKYLAYRRGKSGGESRLHERYSIGFGGHVNEGDADWILDSKTERVSPVMNVAGTLINNIRRELREEIQLPLSINANVEAIIYDASDAVGEVHVGLVLIFDTNSYTATALEECVEKPTFYSFEELQLLNLENWSRLVLEHVIG
jgi:predicted NUDIX family phosphoesterase